MKPQFMQSRARAVVAVLTATVLLSACGSKPEADDIRKQLLPFMQCGPLMVKDVKKTDGAEAANKMYEVAYTFVVEIKGGKEGAAEYFSRWMVLAKQDDAKLQQLFGCGQQPFAGNLLSEMEMTFEKSATGGSALISIPYAAQVTGTAVMQKAESGWVFKQTGQHNVVKVIQSEPVKYDRPKPPTPAASINGVSPSNEVGKSAGASPPTDSQACLDKKIAESRNSKETQEFKKQTGVEPRIPNEVFEEWQASCGVIAAK